MTTPTSMGNHGGTVTSCSPYAYLGYAEIRILHRTWSTVALGTYELAFLIKKKKYWCASLTSSGVPAPFPRLGVPLNMESSPNFLLLFRHLCGHHATAYFTRIVL